MVHVREEEKTKAGWLQAQSAEETTTAELFTARYKAFAYQGVQQSCTL